MLAETKKQVVENILRLNDALCLHTEQKEASRLLAQGKIFIVFKAGDRWLFAPSRFAGYKNNNIRKHAKARTQGQRDGRHTEKKFRSFTQKIDVGDSGYEALDSEYLSLCSKLKITPSNHHRERRYRVFSKQTSDVEFEVKSKKRKLAIEDHAASIARTVANTVKNSGKMSKKKRKLKTTSLSKNEIEKIVKSLMKSQKGVCKLTGLKIRLNSQKELFPSLDRIDSNLGYEVKNLQLVCRFANMWKSDQENGAFLRLIRLIKNA